RRSRSLLTATTRKQGCLHKAPLLILSSIQSTNQSDKRVVGRWRARARDESSEAVVDFEDMHVDTEAGGTVCAGIGEMLEAIPCEKAGNEIEANTGCADNLNRASEVLFTIFIIAEECAPASHVNRNSSPRATQRKAWHESNHEACVIGPSKLPCGGEQPHVEFR